MTTAKERVELELNELEERLGKLKTFVLSKPFSKLSTVQQMLLMSQIDIMTLYANYLHRRLKFWRTEYDLL